MLLNSQVRRNLLEYSSRLGRLEEAQLDLKSAAASAHSAAAACVSDVQACLPAVQLLQQSVLQLQQSMHKAQLQSQDQPCSDNILNELKDQYQQLKREVECMNQLQHRLANIELQQKQILDRLQAAEQLQMQLGQQQHELRVNLAQRELDRSDLQRLLGDKLDLLHERVAQVESHRDSWTAIERLVMSGSGSGVQASRYGDASNEAQLCQQDCSVGDSYVALQTSDVGSAVSSDASSAFSLRIASVCAQFHQQDILPVQLNSRGQSPHPTDADFSVSISANVNQFFFDLHVRPLART